MSKRANPRRKFALSRKYQKFFAAAGVVTIASLIGVAGYNISNNTSGVNAIGSEFELIAPQMSNGYVRSPELDANKEKTTANASPLTKVYRGELPSYYNSHDTYHLYTRTKNQNTEGLCWLYAGSTALEYALEKSDMATSISPKHVDYQFVSENDAYKEVDVAAGAKNSYYNRWVSAGGYERTLGDGGNDYTLLLALSNPFALVSEPDFTNTIKANDTRLNSISKYEDIWTLSNYADILTDINGMQAYTVKQDYNEINNEDNVNYIVTGVGEIISGFYGTSAAKTEAVNKIKSAIKQYGATTVGTFFDTNNCMDYSLDAENNINFTIIDRTISDYTSLCSNSTGHAMTLIGWDDNWQYKDGGAIKTGAFIVQNSWGENDVWEVSTGSGTINAPANYYMSYDSYFDVIYFTDFDAFDAYDHHYSIDNYNTPTITAGANEYVFELTAGDNEEIKKITFNQNFANSLNYELYVSNTGNAADFVKAGEFTAGMGMTGYEFNSPLAVSGNFAIKLVDLSGEDVTEDEYALNILNVYTVDATSEGEEGEGEEGPEQQEDTGTISDVQGRDHAAGDGKDFSFRVDYALDLFSFVNVDGVRLNANDYKVESGSTIVTIYADFLDTLEDGDHAAVAAFTNGHTIGVSFTTSGNALDVPDTSADEDPSKTPDTGAYTKSQDSASSAALYIVVTIVSLGAISGYIASRKKHHVSFRK